MDAKVLYVIGQLRRGGAEQQLYFLLEKWPHSACIVTLEKNTRDGYWVQPIRKLGYDVIELERHGRVDVRRFLGIIQQVHEKQPNIIHLFTDSISGIYGRLAALLYRHPCVIVNERRHPSADPKWYLHLKRLWLNHHIAVMVTNARSSLNFAVTQMGLPPHKAYYIPNGVDIVRFRREPGFDARALLPNDWRDKVIVGTVGSLLPKKAIDIYVRVARRVIDVCPNTRFLHVGKGPMLSNLEALRDDLGLTEYLQFMGERTDVPRILQAIDIFAMTSLNEGMPNAAMEAMAMSLPCVISDAGDTREVVRDGTTGFIVPIGDIEAHAEHIIRLINDEPLRRALGQRAQAVIQGFSVDRMAKRYQELYASLLAANPYE